MHLSALQQKYFAWDLSHKKSTGDDSRFTGVLSEARVDLNPHQVDAALFAFKSPLSKGAILADEVGLGKTIEAGIILSQSWAEHRRRILIVVPASLRNQWNLELREKFFLPSTVLIRSSYDDLIQLKKRPFEQDAIIICSYHFAAKHADEIHSTNWDLVVLDEAHKLRNVYKKNNKISKAIRNALQPYKKVLLTATPLQNNLNELYGLVSIIDGNYFSNIDNFSDEYNAVSTRDAARFGELKARLQNIIQRTLRRQVQEYVRFTKRTAMVQDFSLNPAEQELYDKVSDYLARPLLFAIPDIIRPLMAITIRKIMASSSYALSFTLNTMKHRVEEYLATGKAKRLIDALSENDEILDEDDFDESEGMAVPEEFASVEMAEKAMKEEIRDLESYIALAKSVGEESKAKALVGALALAFQKMEKLGARRKALIFTESRRTQDYLKRYLDAHGYGGRIVCFNGTNDSPETKGIYSRWLSRHKGSDRVTGDPLIDKKQALTDYFEEEADIMIATEAGAEGINLQFCSMVVNYDMPWNPQRIEQRIGRCHRYGQKHDVVVVNFVNQSNAADKRVYELLNTKFNLFEGVFGSSDEILGAIESNIDFEKRLSIIYQTCRTESEINTAFDILQKELEDIISDRMKKTKNALLEHFDEDVVKKLKMRQSVDSERMSLYNKHLWKLALSVLDGKMDDIDEKEHSFTLREGFGDIKPGRYSLSKWTETLQLRSGTPLGQYIIHKGLSQDIPTSEMVFNLSSYPYKSATLEAFKGQSGYCIGYKVSASNEHDNEEELLICGLSDDGELTPDDFGKKLLELDVERDQRTVIPQDVATELNNAFRESLAEYKNELADRIQTYLNTEIDKLYSWADDNMYPLEDEVIALRKQVQANRRAARKATSAMERIELKKAEISLTKKLNDAQAKCNEAREYYNAKSEEQIALLEKSMVNTVSSEELFTIRWSII